MHAMIATQVRQCAPPLPLRQCSVARGSRQITSPQSKHCNCMQHVVYLFMYFKYTLQCSFKYTLQYSICARSCDVSCRRFTTRTTLMT
jgi:hypothetical protein